MKRREAERLAIAHAVEIGSIDFMESQNITAEHFKHNRKLADVLWQKAYELDGDLPSPEFFGSFYGNFDFTPPKRKADVQECLNLIRDWHGADLLNKTLLDMKPFLTEGANWKEMLDFIPTRIEDIKSSIEVNRPIDFAADFRKRHEYVRQRAEQRASGNWRVNFAHPGMNDHFGGYESGLYLYVARTGKGKTWSCLLDLWHTWNMGTLLDEPTDVGIFSLEMDDNKVGLRLDTFGSHFSNYNLNRGIIRRDGNIQDPKLLEEEARAYQEYGERIKREQEEGKRGKFKIWTMDTLRGNVTPRRIESLIREEKLDFVVIDQLELVNADSKTNDERARLNEVSREFKLMAGRLNIPILVPHQMNRETIKAKEVTDANVAGSDGPARHAEFVCYLTRDENSKYMFYNFLKARNVPIDRQFCLSWDWDIGRYKEVDPDIGKIQELNDILKKEDKEALEEVEGEWA